MNRSVRRRAYHRRRPRRTLCWLLLFLEKKTSLLVMFIVRGPYPINRDALLPSGSQSVYVSTFGMT